MIEKVYNLSQSQDKLVEKPVTEEKFQYIHMIFNKDEGLPQHVSNGNLFMTVLQGTLSIKLNDETLKSYPKGTLLNIPQGIVMNVNNISDEQLELIVMKIFE